MDQIKAKLYDPFIALAIVLIFSQIMEKLGTEFSVLAVLPWSVIYFFSIPLISMGVGIIYLAFRFKILKWNDFYINSRYQIKVILVGSFLLFAYIINVRLYVTENEYIHLLLNLPELERYYYYLVLVVLSPVFEEVFMRAYICEIFRNLLGFLPALIITSLFTVVTHAQNLGNLDIGIMLQVFIGGMLFSGVYLTGGLVPSILLHSAYNYFFLDYHLKLLP